MTRFQKLEVGFVPFLAQSALQRRVRLTGTVEGPFGPKMLDADRIES
jgi:hypothetical protein